ncbi:RING/U-box superfamily protein [Abeliophyllum distichum]|uniref:RING-type E3 ubiquitin transferase n=1 Tax=Abeliophyllum distichum TaxID=126358 RepID=A0ABD1SX61_9LAMI
MASSESESDSSPEPPSLEELSTRGATAFLLPRIISMAAASTTPSSQQPRDVVVFVNQATGSITLIEGSIDIEMFLRDMPGKKRLLPASKDSIESMPVVKITEPGSECSICLMGFELNGEVKEMPCKHKFHSSCIEKWLRFNGSCPICRFTLPVEEKKESDSEEEEERGRREEQGMRIHVFFTRGVNRREASDTNIGSGQSGSGSGSGSESNPGLGIENRNGLSHENMEMDGQDIIYFI